MAKTAVGCRDIDPLHRSADSDASGHLMDDFEKPIRHGPFHRVLYGVRSSADRYRRGLRRDRTCPPEPSLSWHQVVVTYFEASLYPLEIYSGSPKAPGALHDMLLDGVHTNTLDSVAIYDFSNPIPSFPRARMHSRSSVATCSPLQS